MKKPEEIAKALHLCYNPPSSCDDCPYDDCGDCVATAAKDAEECIRALVDKLPRWISVKERLPEKHEGVIVHCNDGFLTLMCYDGRDWQWNGKKDNSVTHWMPLPERPKEE